MRLLQRLAAGMCERRIAELRQSRTTLGRAARQRPWAKVPRSVQQLLEKAVVLKDQMDLIEQQVQRAGYAFQDYGLRKLVRGQEPVTLKDAEKRERESHKIIDLRISGIQEIKERALRDLLGMSETDGKVYLNRLERELAGDR